MRPTLRKCDDVTMTSESVQRQVERLKLTFRQTGQQVISSKYYEFHFWLFLEMLLFLGTTVLHLHDRPITGYTVFNVWDSI